MNIEYYYLSIMIFVVLPLIYVDLNQKLYCSKWLSVARIKKKSLIVIKINPKTGFRLYSDYNFLFFTTYFGVKNEIQDVCQPLRWTHTQKTCWKDDTHSPRSRSQIFSIWSGCKYLSEVLSNSSISLVGDSMMPRQEQKLNPRAGAEERQIPLFSWAESS